MPKKGTAAVGVNVDLDDFDDDFDELDQFVAERYGNPEFRGAYEDAGHRAAVLRRITQHRHEAKLTQSDVAERMGTTQSAISEIEGGASDPRLSTLFRYCRAVDLRMQLRLSGQFEAEQVKLLVFDRVSDAKRELEPVRVGAQQWWAEKAEKVG